PRSGGDHAAARRALQGRMVGAAAHRRPAQGRGGGARPDRQLRGARGPRRGDRTRVARDPHGGARAAVECTRTPARAQRRARERRMSAPRFQLADELLRRVAASLRSAQLYSPGHPIIARNLESLSTAFQLLHSLQPSVVVGIVGEEVIVDDMPMAKADTLGSLIRRLQQSGVERITVERGVTTDELATFIEAITTVEGRPALTGNATP